MTKTLNKAIVALSKLPAGMQDVLGEKLLANIEKYLSLHKDLKQAKTSVNQGKGISEQKVFSKLQARYGS